MALAHSGVCVKENQWRAMTDFSTGETARRGKTGMAAWRRQNENERQFSAWSSDQSEKWKREKPGRLRVFMATLAAASQSIWRRKTIIWKISLLKKKKRESSDGRQWRRKEGGWLRRNKYLYSMVKAMWRKPNSSSQKAGRKEEKTWEGEEYVQITFCEAEKGQRREGEEKHVYIPMKRLAENILFCLCSILTCCVGGSSEREN